MTEETEGAGAFLKTQEAGRKLVEHLRRSLLSREKPKPYRDPNRGRPRITPQKMDRKVLAAIRNGAKTAASLLQALEEFEAFDLRISVQRLLDNNSLSINEKGEFVRTE